MRTADSNTPGYSGGVRVPVLSCEKCNLKEIEPTGVYIWVDDVSLENFLGN